MDERIWFGVPHPVGTGRVSDVCLWLACGGVCGIGGEWVAGLDQSLEEWTTVMSV